MSTPPSRALSFGADAASYDAFRPPYPAELYDHLLSGPSAQRVLEVGAGTGQATRDLASRGAHVVALEPDRRLAEILAAKALPSVQVVVSSFENWDAPEQSFDILASAQAWHWVDPAEGVERAARALKGGGLLALWWNMPSSRRSESSQRLDHVYQSLAPELLDSSVMVRAKSDGRHTRGVAASSAFETIDEVEYEWSQKYTPDAYVALLATHSDHRAMDQARRQRLLDAIYAEAAEMGSVEFRYVTECLIATRH